MQFRFFLNPEINRSNRFFSLIHIKEFFYVYCLSILSVIFLIMPLYFLDKAFFEAFFQTISNLHSDILYKNFVYSVILIPFLEELQFRLPIEFNLRNLNIFLSIFLSNFVFKSLITLVDLTDSQFFNYLIFILTAVLLFYFFNFFFQKFKFSINIPTIYSFYFFNALFAILHLGNFNKFLLSEMFFYFLYILILFIDSCLIGYLRCKYGIFSGLLFHIIKNLIVFI